MQCGRRKQVCGLRSAAEDVNSLARLEPMRRVGGKADTCGGLTTDTALVFFSFDSILDWLEVDIYQLYYRILPHIELGPIHSDSHLR